MKNQNQEKSSPKKPPSISDLAIRAFIQDLLNRGQINTFDHFSKDIGFGAAQQLRQFMQKQINFPRPKLQYAINALIEKYGASENFLIAGSGELYKDKPYVTPISTISHTASSNILSMNEMKKLQQLQIINEQLKERIAYLEKFIDNQNKLLDRQNIILDRLSNGIRRKKTGSKTGGKQK